jgi:hypothetical protein
MVLAVVAIVVLDVAVIGGLALLMRSATGWGTGLQEAKQIERRQRVRRRRVQTVRRTARRAIGAGA